MQRRVALLLVVLSLALNAAFVTGWAFRVLPSLLQRVDSAATDSIWCPLHRRLAVTRTQWRLIEPRLIQFQKAARGVCKDVNRSREELIRLLAESEPDMEAVGAKREQILAGQRRMQGLVVDWLLAEKEALNPEQQGRLFELLRHRAGCAGHAPIAGPLRGGPSCTALESETLGEPAPNE